MIKLCLLVLFIYLGKLKEEYKHEKVNFNSDMNLSASPVINSSISVGHGPWALGYNTAFDTGNDCNCWISF